jgi:thiamine-monophosphate kinase
MERTELHTVGEFGLIDRIRELVDISVDDVSLKEQLRRGIGDDAAVFKPTPGKFQVLTTDAMVEGVHFDLTFTSMKHLGWKAIVSNMSDVAAMLGVPRYATVVLALPKKISVEMVEEFYEGALFACKRYGCLIVGGDTTTTYGNMSVTVAMTGEVDEGEVALRSGARAGDLICVTGHLGSAHAGLKVLLREKEKFRKHGNGEPFVPTLEPYKGALEKYFMPQPRLDIVKILAGRIPVHAMIDISDGLASEIHHLCRSSDVGAEVWEHSVPVDNIAQQIAKECSDDILEYALHGGEEYQLLFTLGDEDYKMLERLTSDVSIVGRVVAKEKGLELVRENGEREALPQAGWNHFTMNT